MSDFQTCYLWTMVSEDPRLSYAQVKDICPRGCPGPCFAISGINSGVFPAEFAAIAAIPQSQRGPAVAHFYQTNFWNQWYAQLASDDVAKRVFDEAVNAGPGTAVKILQAAINSTIGDPANHLTVDGGWGPRTVDAANAVSAVVLVPAFQAARVAHYRAIADANPADAADLPGWLARAER